MALVLVGGVTKLNTLIVVYPTRCPSAVDFPHRLVVVLRMHSAKGQYCNSVLWTGGGLGVILGKRELGPGPTEFYPPLLPYKRPASSR
jgi:hypothetical protein